MFVVISGVLVHLLMLAVSLDSLLSASRSYVVSARRIPPSILRSVASRSRLAHSGRASWTQLYAVGISCVNADKLLESVVCGGLSLGRQRPLLSAAIAASRLRRAHAGDRRSLSSSSSCAVESTSTCSNDAYPSGPPCGIVNLGDTCYLASALQLLYRSDAYRNAVLRSAFEQGSVGSKLQDLFRNMSREELVNPHALASALEAPLDEQQDAQEFGLRLINEVDASVLAPPSSPCGSAGAVPGDALRGVLGNCVDRQSGGRVVAEPFYGLSLPIPASAATLEQCLRAYFQGDENHTSQLQSIPDSLIIDLKRFSYDQRRHQVVKLSQRVSFPKSLNISEYMNASTDGSVSDALYELSAVIVHLGSADFGHYLTYVRTPPGGSRSMRRQVRKAPPAKLFFSGSRGDESDDEEKDGEAPSSGAASDASGAWFLCDDAVVTPADFSAVAEDGFGVSGSSGVKLGAVSSSSAAYALLYERKK